MHLATVYRAISPIRCSRPALIGIVYRAISTHLVHKAGYQLKDAATGAVTLIQRFGSALNLNIHFHALFLDGVYVYRDNRSPWFRRVSAAPGMGLFAAVAT